MKLRTLIVTIVVLAAASGAVWFLNRPAPPPSADARLGQSLVGRAAIDQAAKLRVTDQGKSVTVARQPDGSWRVPSYHDFPADFSKISALAGNLTDAKLERLVTSSPERIARLEFKDTKIELLDASDKELWSVTLGKNPEAGGGRFVRFGTEQKAFLASLSVWLDTEPKNWASAELLNLKADDIAKVEIPFADGGPVTVSRAKKDDPWTADKTPADHRVKADKIASVLTSVGTLRFSETTDLADANFAAAKSHARLFKLTTFAGKTVTVTLGRKPEEKRPKPVAATPTPPAPPAADPAAAPAPAKPAEPEMETIPAGPVFAEVTSSVAADTVNALMTKRAFQISEYSFTGLPQKSDELFEPAPPPPAPAPAVTLPPAAVPPKN